MKLTIRSPAVLKSIAGALQNVLVGENNGVMAKAQGKLLRCLRRA